MKINNKYNSCQKPQNGFRVLYVVNLTPPPPLTFDNQLVTTYFVKQMATVPTTVAARHHCHRVVSIKLQTLLRNGQGGHNNPTTAKPNRIAMLSYPYNSNQNRVAEPSYPYNGDLNRVAKLSYPYNGDLNRVAKLSYPYNSDQNHVAKPSYPYNGDQNRIAKPSYPYNKPRSEAVVSIRQRPGQQISRKH